MVNRCIFQSFVLFSSFLLSAFEKLPSEYQISYGCSEAPIKVVEYYSLSCPKCLKTFREDFKAIREKYIDSKKVHWTFHINPTDVLSLQAMVCLEQLSQENKRIFLEALLEVLDDPSQGSLLMKAAMETFGKPIPQLADISYLKNTASFKSAYKYLKQPDIVKEIPTVEINGKVQDAFPSRKFVEKQLSALVIHGGPS